MLISSDSKASFIGALIIGVLILKQPAKGSTLGLRNGLIVIMKGVEI
jgi:hypothetical protein